MPICGSDESGFSCTLDICQWDYPTASLGPIVGILDKREIRGEGKKKIIDKYDRKQSPQKLFHSVGSRMEEWGGGRPAMLQSLSVLYSARAFTYSFEKASAAALSSRHVCGNRRVTFVT